LALRVRNRTTHHSARGQLHIGQADAYRFATRCRRALLNDACARGCPCAPAVAFCMGYDTAPSMPAYVAPRLVITDALGRRTIPIERPLLTFGRRSECDVRVTGADVSRQHAELLNQDGKILLRDAGSKFGTFVNGEKI